jgi:hypothetical protein
LGYARAEGFGEIALDIVGNIFLRNRDILYINLKYVDDLTDLLELDGYTVICRNDNKFHIRWA